jgi:excinuclease ABC subunit C
MLAHAEALAFEQAAEVRNQISALSKVLHQQSMESSSDQDVDILAVKVQGGRACVNLAMVRGGRHLGDRPYFPSHIEEGVVLAGWGNERRSQRGAAGAGGLHGAALHRCGAAPGAGAGRPGGRGTAGDLLAESCGMRLHTVFNPREHRRAWLDMAQTNADLQLARLLAEEGSQQARTRALAEALDLPAEDLSRLRIECFDISHTAGEATVASCVVFEEHKMQSASTAATTSTASPPATTTPPCGRCCSGATASWPRPCATSPTRWPARARNACRMLC